MILEVSKDPGPILSDSGHLLGTLGLGRNGDLHSSLELFD